MAKNDLTAGDARQFFTYEPDTGLLRWKVKRGPVSIGGIAGGIHQPSGYLQMWCNGFNYRAHRIAWLLKTDAWPSGFIDHIDGVRHNNRWSNLRDVNKSLNAQNQASTIGVYKHGLRWRFQIRANGKLHRASFPDIETAREAYRNAKAELHPAWARR